MTLALIDLSERFVLALGSLFCFVALGLSVSMLPTWRSMGAALFQLSARTVYVNSATGSDTTGDGTLARPWQTLLRAFTDRQAVGKLYVTYTVQLQGTGPYELPTLSDSACDTGFFVMRGDATARTIVVTGTATGDFSGNTLPTSALGATDALRDSWIRMTSGACNGAIFQINSNNANDLTVAQKRARTQLGAIVNGDTFEVIRPGTAVRISSTSFTAPILPDGQSTVFNVQGMTRNLFNEPVPRHYFFDLNFTTSDASSLVVSGSTLGLCMCRLERGISFDYTCLIVGGMIPWSGVLDGSAVAFDQKLYGAGFAQVSAGAISALGGQLFGVFSWNNSFSTFGGASVLWCGGRTGTLSLANLSSFEAFGSDADQLFLGTATVQSGATLRVGSGTGLWRASVSSGNVLTVRRGGLAIIETAFTGGTAAAAGYGCDVRGGGRAIYVNTTPALTGGTAGNDLRTTNVAVIANATLNANGVAAGNATDVLLGEVLSRVAA